MTDLALIIENFKFEFPFIQILMGSSQVFVCDNSLVKKSNSSYQFTVVHPERARQDHPKKCRAEDPKIVKPFICLVTGINFLRWIARETVKGSREVAMRWNNMFTMSLPHIFIVKNDKVRLCSLLIVNLALWCISPNWYNMLCYIEDNEMH